MTFYPWSLILRRFQGINPISDDLFYFVSLISGNRIDNEEEEECTIFLTLKVWVPEHTINDEDDNVEAKEEVELWKTIATTIRKKNTTKLMLSLCQENS